MFVAFCPGKARITMGIDALILFLAVLVSAVNLVLAIGSLFVGDRRTRFWQTSFLVAGSVSVIASASIQLELLYLRSIGETLSEGGWKWFVMVLQLLASLFQTAFLVDFHRRSRKWWRKGKSVANGIDG